MQVIKQKTVQWIAELDLHSLHIFRKIKTGGGSISPQVKIVKSMICVWSIGSSEKKAHLLQHWMMILNMKPIY